MLVTASWGGGEVAVEVDAGCRSVDGLRRCLQEALPEVDVEAVRLEVCGRPVDDEAVLGLVDGSVIDVSASQAALAAATLREEGCAVDLDGFCSVAEAGDVRRCKLYLEVGLVCSAGRANPLHHACDSGHLEICKLLLARDIAIDIKDLCGDTPLHLACYRGQLETSKLLLDHHCAIDAENDCGDTPLHAACYAGSVEVCRLLLDRGCAIDVQSIDKSTPLHLACSEGQWETCKLLLECGFSTDVSDDDGFTPLHLACESGHCDISKLLLEHSCVNDAKDNSGDTPLHITCRKSNVEICKLLLDRSCPIDAKNAAALTPLEIAETLASLTANGLAVYNLILERQCVL